MSMQNRSWIQLLSFRVTVALGFAILVAALFVGAAAAFAASSQEQDGDAQSLPVAGTYSGVISDSHCGAKHSTTSGKTSAECTRSCVRHGAKYTLVSGDKAYILVGNNSEFDSLAGQRTELTGTLDRDILKVTSISTQ